jgi:diguanylate cyclase (GGDEF)-like protein
MTVQLRDDPYGTIRELQEKLAEALAEIENLGRDCVSGVATRAVFEKHLEGMFRRNRRDDSPIGVILCDIDYFKKVNDTLGHRVGDDVIADVAQAIRSCTRTTDIVARYGSGDEFISMVVQADIPGLAVLSERIRKAVEALDADGSPKVTISVGFALQDERDKTGKDVVERADQALYRAKHLGRNRVESEPLGHEEIRMIEEIDKTRN